MYTTIIRQPEILKAEARGFEPLRRFLDAHGLVPQAKRRVQDLNLCDAV